MSIDLFGDLAVEDRVDGELPVDGSEHPAALRERAACWTAISVDFGIDGQVGVRAWPAR